jgi:hypothetical protein
MPMAQPVYTREAAMLTLAAIAYRGYDLILPQAVKVPLMREAMNRCLATLGPVKDKWAIVWGPASHPSGRLKFDDAAMYVAQSLEEANTIVIAIRGTNPPSLADWIRGDLMVKQMHRWASAPAGGAKVSLSTINGLELLRNLAAQPLIPDMPVASSGKLDWVRSIKPHGPDDVRSWLIGTMEALGSNAHTAAAIEVINEAREREAGGVNLSGLLKARIAYWRAEKASEPLQIHVTGHSKGGTLGSALALWLADTQGQGPEHWSDRHEAKINLYSFAAPTAGNAAFASHLNNTFGTRSHRIYNKYDVVPRAWDDLNAIPALYGAANPWLVKIAGEISMHVGPLNYKQPGTAIERSPKLLDDSKPVPWQIIYQHLDGYFEALGLLGEMTAGTFLNPLPF